MADLIRTCMIAPATGVTYNTIDGTPYRADETTGTVDVTPQHVAELTARGFTAATATQVPAGDPLQEDSGWAVAN